MSINFNTIAALGIFIRHIRRNQDPDKWFEKYARVVGVFTLISAVDIETLNLLSSGFAGLKIFSAPLEDAEKPILWCGFCNMFIEDLPQLIIQVNKCDNPLFFCLNSCI